MKLSDLTPQERRDLADRAGTNPVYLYQCGAGLRLPSPALAKRLMRADPRLTWESLYGPVDSVPTDPVQALSDTSFERHLSEVAAQQQEAA